MPPKSPFIYDCIRQNERVKSLGDRAVSQVDDAQFFQDLGEDANSIAIIIKHLAGNMRSRWTDFLTTDGEKASRNRDEEFAIHDSIRQSSLVAKRTRFARLCSGSYTTVPITSARLYSSPR